VNNYSSREQELLHQDNNKIKELLENRQITTSIEKIEICKNCDGPQHMMYITSDLMAHKIYKTYLRDNEKAQFIIKSIAENNNKAPFYVFKDLRFNTDYNKMLPTYQRYVDEVANVKTLKHPLLNKVIKSLK
jgi:hypothetical protein